MEQFKPKTNVHDGPEAKIQGAIVKYLRHREWFVKETHGNAFQSGFPDLYATHSLWRQRWIEIKYPYAFKFTDAQVRDYPKFNANGSPVWIMTAAWDEEYDKLFRPSNLQEYMSCFQDGCRDIIAWRRGQRQTPISERKPISYFCTDK